MMDQEILKTLYSKGHISKGTYEKGLKKFSDGGVAASTIPEYLKPNSDYAPVSESSISPAPVSPDVQAAANKAIENTAIQAQKLAPSNIVEQTIQGLPSKIATAPEKSAEPYSKYYEVLKQVGPETTQKLVEAGKLEAPPSFVQSNIIEPLKNIREQNIQAEQAKLKALGISTEEPQQSAKLTSTEQPQVLIEKPKAENPYLKLATEYDKTFDQMEKGIKSEEDATRKTASAITSAYNQSIDDFKQQQAIDRVANEVNQEKLENKRIQYEKQVDDLTKQSAIDPNRFWNNKTSGQKTMAALAIFLGGIGGGTNEVMNQINREIDRDIESQKNAIGQKQNALALQSNIYSMMNQQFNDDRAARLASKNAMLSMFEMQVKKAEASTGNLVAKAKAQTLLGQLENKKIETQMELLKAYQNSGANLESTNETKKISALPIDLQKEAYKELGEYNKLQSAIKETDRIFVNLMELSKPSKMLTSPMETSSLREKAEADLFPIVKQIVGEKMTDSDARILISSQLPKFKDSDEVKQKKLNDLKAALTAQIEGRTPILSGHNIIKKQIPLSLKRND